GGGSPDKPRGTTSVRCRNPQVLGRHRRRTPLSRQRSHLLWCPAGALLPLAIFCAGGWDGGSLQQARAAGGSMSVQHLAPDAEPAMFDPAAFSLERKAAELIERARRFGQTALAPRAARHDRDATFPIESFRDMHPEGLLAICVPEADGGLGASYRTYCLAAAELGRY